MKRDRTLINVSIFTVVMLLVAAGLVVVFGAVPLRLGQHLPRHLHRGVAAQGRTGRPDRRRAGRLGQGASSSTRTTPSTSTFDVNNRYQLYTSTRARGALREPGRRPLPRDHLGPGRSAQAAAGRHHRQGEHPARAGPRRAARRAAPVLKGLDGNKVNEVSNAVIELLQGQGGALSNLLVQHGVVHPEPRRPRPADRRRDQQPQHGARHGRREGRAVRRQRRPAAAADHRAGREPRPDRGRHPAAGLGRPTT